MSKPRLPVVVVFLAGAALLASSLAGAAAAAEKKPAVKPALPASWVNAFHWRSIGPTVMGGRITDIAVNEKDPIVWWVATASGGLLKTTDNGITFTHQFDHEQTVSIGDVAVSPSNPEIVWVGTGEANPRNSVSWGNGVYKSTDGGKTWKHMGLDRTFQIGRIQIHPENPDIVYVGALGRLWGPNEERGLYKTADGGKTWKKVLYIDDKTGVVDVRMSPADPETLLVATYERQRDLYDSNAPSKKWGPGGGLYRTTDGGKTFHKVTKGLPSCSLGRIGLDWYRKDPRVVFAVVESEKIGQEPENAPYLGASGTDAEVGARITEVKKDEPAAKAGLKTGDIVLSVGGTKVYSYADFLRAVRRYKAGDTVKFEIVRDKKGQTVEVTFGKRPKPKEEESEDRPSFRRRGGSPFSSGLGGQRENVQDQQGEEGYQYGGVYKSEDGGETWVRVNSVNPRPMYFSQIRVDPSDANYLYVLGISLYRSKDGGKTFEGDGGRGVHPDHHALWIDPRDGRHMILGNDGGIYVTYDRMEHWDHLNHVAIGQFYHVAVGPRPDYKVYGGLQDNGSWGGPSFSRSGDGIALSDWFRVGGGDGFICRVDPNDPDLVYYASQNGGLGRTNFRTGEQGFLRPPRRKGVRYRFNWKTPYIISHHNPGIYYTAGNYVFRSVWRGESMKVISPEITRTDKGAATAMAESRFDPDVLYVGTDDGALWRTDDGGHEWIDLFKVEAKEEGGEKPAAAPPAGEEGGRRRRPGGAFGRGRPRGGERGSGRRGSFMAAMLKRLDADGDGLILKREVPERALRIFERADADGNGMVDRKEMDALAGRAGPETEGTRAAGEAVPEKPVSPEKEGGAEAGEPAGGKEGAPPVKPAAGAEAKKAEGTVEKQEEPPGKKETAAKATREKEQKQAEETGVVQEKEKPETVSKEKKEAKEGAAEAPKAPAEDPISGVWKAHATGDMIPPGEGRSTLTLTLKPDGRVTGVMSSPMGEAEISEGTYDPKTRKLTLTLDAQQMTFDVEGTVEKDRVTGTIEMAGGAFSFGFEAKRVSKPAPGAPAAEAEEETPYEWKALKELLPDHPLRVSSIETSRFKKDRVYVTFDGHRSDDDRPYLLLSENAGRTWRALTENLPAEAGSARVVREDLENERLLYLGTEFGLWVSIDRGATWTRFHANLPTVAVHEVAQHPTRGEIVAATHGRSLWITDVTPLRQMTPEVLREPAFLFRPNTVYFWMYQPSRGGPSRRFEADPPPSGAEIYYLINGRVGLVRLTILDALGKEVRTLEAPAEPGLHKVTWDCRRAAPAGRGGPSQGRRFRYRRRGRRVPAGTYQVRLRVDDEIFVKPLEIKSDPAHPEARFTGFEESED